LTVAPAIFSAIFARIHAAANSPKLKGEPKLLVPLVGVLFAQCGQQVTCGKIEQPLE